MIFFRGQRLTPQQHIDFSARFGELLEVPFVRALDGYPAILPVMKGKAETSAACSAASGAQRHELRAGTAAGLGAVRRQFRPGGDTMWAICTAPDTLSDRFKQMLDGLNAVHSAVRSAAQAGRW